MVLIDLLRDAETAESVVQRLAAKACSSARPVRSDCAP